MLNLLLTFVTSENIFNFNNFFIIVLHYIIIILHLYYTAQYIYNTVNKYV